jgi:hypothetical protein
VLLRATKTAMHFSEASRSRASRAEVIPEA